MEEEKESERKSYAASLISQTWESELQNSLKRIADTRGKGDERSIRDRLKSIFGAKENKGPGYVITRVMEYDSDSSEFEKIEYKEFYDYSEPLVSKKSLQEAQISIDQKSDSQP